MVVCHLTDEHLRSEGRATPSPLIHCLIARNFNSKHEMAVELPRQGDGLVPVICHVDSRVKRPLTGRGPYRMRHGQTHRIASVLYAAPGYWTHRTRKATID